MRLAVASVFEGQKFSNEATPYVAEFIRRKRLKSLGITASESEFDELKLDIFLLISEEFDALERKKMDRQKRNRR